MAIAPMRCTMIDDPPGVLMERGQWRQTIAASDLPSWVWLYRGLRDRLAGKYAHIYAQPTAALESAAATAGITIPKNQPTTRGPRK